MRSCVVVPPTAARRSAPRPRVASTGLFWHVRAAFRPRGNRGRPPNQRTGTMTLGYWLIVAAGLLAVVYGVVTAISVMNADAGTERMKEIAAAVQEGAGAYLNRQYRTIALAGVVILIILGFTLGRYTAIGFFIGSVLSGAAGYIGMNISVRANVRTAQAARSGLGAGLALAFRAGAITGMLVVGLGLLGVSIYYAFLRAMLPGPDVRPILEALVALSFG